MVGVGSGVASGLGSRLVCRELNVVASSDRMIFLRSSCSVAASTPSLLNS